MPEHETEPRRRIALSPSHKEWTRLKRAAGRQSLSAWVLWAALTMADRVEGKESSDAADE